VADRKNNEVASLELGLKNVTLQRTMDGFFVGSNFPQDPKLIREETNYDTADSGLSSNARHERWLALMAQYKGKIDVAAGQKFLADHYDFFEKKIDPDERTLCGHIDLSPRGVSSWWGPYGLAGAAFQPRPHSGQKVIVSHVGTVYSASSPRYYLDALDAMAADIRSTIETRFIGRVVAEEAHFLASRKSAVQALGFMPQDAAVHQMEEADYLLLVMTDAASLTGKLFEYLATGKPILAIVQPDGEVARILHETGAGWYAAPDDAAGIRSLLQQAYQRARNPQNGFKPNWEAIRRFERPRLAAEFGKLLANA